MERRSILALMVLVGLGIVLFGAIAVGIYFIDGSIPLGMW